MLWERFQIFLNSDKFLKKVQVGLFYARSLRLMKLNPIVASLQVIFAHRVSLLCLQGLPLISMLFSITLSSETRSTMFTKT